MARRAPMDFAIRYNPDEDTLQTVSRKIFYNIIIRSRIRNRKPVVIFISGDSGEGKSYAGLKLQEILLEAQGYNLKDYMNDINVYVPLDYPIKKRALLKDKRLRHINIICVHEARDLVKAKLWFNFINQAISDINAMSRAVKPLCIMIISQFIRDISTDIRYTLNFYCKVSRGGGASKLRIYHLYKDDYDLERPKLKKRKLSGYLIYPNGKYRRFIPNYFMLSKPDDDICREFDRHDTLAKSKILDKKINDLVKNIQKDLGTYENKKIEAMVDFYANHLEQMHVIVTRYRDKIIINKDALEAHELTKEEGKEFIKLFAHELRERGVLPPLETSKEKPAQEEIKIEAEPNESVQQPTV